MSQNLDEEENDRRWLILRSKLFEEKLKSAFRLFRENGVEPVLIKGWAAAKEYPGKHERVFSDIDLCVAPSDFEKSQKIIASQEGSRLNIDLHCGLRHLDRVDWETLFQNSEIVRIDDEPIRILRAEDHLRVLCVHWLTDGGAYKERLLDIFYLLEKNKLNFDWNACFGLIDDNRRDWIIKTVGIVKKYYGLDITHLPFAEEADNIPVWVIKELEREWASEAKLINIIVVWNDWERFWKQFKKRIRPNAIQATVFMEGKFDESTRVFYQIGSFFFRLKLGLKRFLLVFKNNLFKKNEK